MVSISRKEGSTTANVAIIEPKISFRGSGIQWAPPGSCLLYTSIFLVAFIGTKKYKLNPIGMIVACGIAGLILY